jgi:ADP-ribosylglycohydrolase
LIFSGGDVDIFSRDLARRFRYWLLGLPAGIGFATLRSILKLWLGFSPRKSGVYSAGNGPAMRSAITGVCYGDDEDRLKDFVRAATIITHTDPKAYWGALAVALAAHENITSHPVDPRNYRRRLKQGLESENAMDFVDLISRAVESAAGGNTTREFVASLNLSEGITGYTYHSVPAVIHAWLRNARNFRNAVLEIIECGGDTDTTAAILGGIVGAAVGPVGIPQNWLDNLSEWPRTISWMKQLARQLAAALQSARADIPPRLPVLGILLRNLLFAAIVMLHAVRRMLPPY